MVNLFQIDIVERLIEVYGADAVVDQLLGLAQTADDDDLDTLESLLQAADVVLQGTPQTVQ